MHLMESLKSISSVLPHQTRNAGYIFAILWNGANVDDDGSYESRNNTNVVMFSCFMCLHSDFAALLPVTKATEEKAKQRQGQPRQK